MTSQAFGLDEALARDSIPVLRLGLCQMRLMNDSRWPWLILVPQRPGIREIHDLSPLDQTLLSFEITTVSETLKRITKCHKINIGALGNMVEQLHVHVIARDIGDPNWPGPVWGSGAATPYPGDVLGNWVKSLRSSF